MSGKKDYRIKYRNPDEETARRILRRRLTIDELFVDGRDEDDTVLQDKHTIAEFYVIKAFLSARVAKNTRCSSDFLGTPNRILGVSGSIEELATRIVSEIGMRSVWVTISRRDLPDQYARLSQPWAQKVVSQAMQLLVIDVLLDMRDGDEWEDSNSLYYQFHDDLGDFAWVVPTSVTDKHDELRLAVREIYRRTRPEERAPIGNPIKEPKPKVRVKRDDRSFHGRTNRDRKQSAVA